MKISNCHVLTALAGMLVTSHVTFGQVSLTPNRAPFLTSDQLTAAATTEALAASIVSQALAEHVRIFPNRTTTVIGAQIPENWLPAIPGVKFLRLTDDAARAHLQQCGKLLYVHWFRLVTNELATIAVAEGNRCGSTGSDLRFRRSKDGWRLETDGLHAGFGSGSECVCR